MNRQAIQHAFNQAIQRQKAGALAEASAIYRHLLLSLPKSAEIRVNLGVALKDLGQVEQAVEVLREALEIQPNSPTTWSNLGIAWRAIGRLDEAIPAFEKAIELNPKLPIPWNNLALTFQDAGRLDDALRCFNSALAIDPTIFSIDSNRLYALHFHEQSTAKKLLDAHKRWAKRHAEPLKQTIRSFDNKRQPHRRLRIGYVSGDLREHAVGRFLLPLLECHNPAKFQVHCYNNRAGPIDALGKQLQSHTKVWRDIANLSDEEAAELIRQDRIDILVDLSMHMAGNRLLLFARKPAPIQVTYLAYCGTTGLDLIDYRITDPYLDPKGKDDGIYIEQSHRLPKTYWCYQPAVETTEPNPPPMLTAGHITFGCLNNFCKVSPGALAVWFALLRAVPTARLILHAHEGKHRQHVCDLATADGIDPARLTFVGFQPLAQYMETYRRIDIALDSFPYSGGTTTCDALWMGVPVVTLSGDLAVGRGGVSILSNIGLPEFIASTKERYIEIAEDLAGDLPRLTDLRKTLRGRMQKSPLMDAAEFARKMELAYRKMWKNWCGASD